MCNVKLCVHRRGPHVGDLKLCSLEIKISTECSVVSLFCLLIGKSLNSYMKNHPVGYSFNRLNQTDQKTVSLKNRSYVVFLQGAAIIKNFLY